MKTKEVKDLEKKIDELQSTLINHFYQTTTDYQVKTERLMGWYKYPQVEKLEQRLDRVEAVLKEIKNKL